MFTAAPVVTKADWSSNVLKPADDQSQEDPKFTSEARVNFYSDNAALYDADMVTYEFKWVYKIILLSAILRAYWVYFRITKQPRLIYNLVLI